MLAFDGGGLAVLTPDGRFDTDRREAITGIQWVFQVDPFRAERIEVAAAGTRSSDAKSKIAEHEKRVKEPLEAFPLESISMP